MKSLHCPFGDETVVWYRSTANLTRHTAEDHRRFLSVYSLLRTSVGEMRGLLAKRWQQEFSEITLGLPGVYDRWSIPLKDQSLTDALGRWEAIRATWEENWEVYQLEGALGGVRELLECWS